MATHGRLRCYQQQQQLPLPLQQQQHICQQLRPQACRQHVVMQQPLPALLRQRCYSTWQRQQLLPALTCSRHEPRSSSIAGGRPSVRVAAASSASADAFGDSSSSSAGAAALAPRGVLAAASSLAAGVGGAAADLQDLCGRFMGLWRSFLPMLSLFFCLSFVNTILDSLKDTLVITAPGGGAFVIPYLTVYAVLPLSMVFLVAFSAASHRMSRASLFNTIVAVFMAFFGVFGLFLYPNADALHPHALADQLQQVRLGLVLCCARGMGGGLVGRGWPGS